jgi:hypothetical protein
MPGETVKYSYICYINISFYQWATCFGPKGPLMGYVKQHKEVVEI